MRVANVSDEFSGAQTSVRPVIIAIAAALLGACHDERPFIECVDDGSCRLAPGGQCLANPETSHLFCAYPDASCPGGLRWSDLDVESPISGACVATAEPDAGVDAATDAPIDAPTPDAPSDAPPPNCNLAPVCAAPIDLGTITADDHPFPQPFPLRVAYESNGDPAWYRVRLADTTGGGNLESEIRLQMSMGTNYDMRVFCMACGGQLASIGDQVNQLEIASTRRNDTTADNSHDILIEVTRHAGSPGCGPYLLEVTGNQPLGVVTCD